MRAWAVVENGKPLREIELPTPEPKGTEVLVEVTHCSITLRPPHREGVVTTIGGQKMSLADRGVTLPLAMGHEIVGRVVKLGPDAKGVKVGDIRIVYPWLGCGTAKPAPPKKTTPCVKPPAVWAFTERRLCFTRHRTASAI